MGLKTAAIFLSLAVIGVRSLVLLPPPILPPPILPPPILPPPILPPPILPPPLLPPPLLPLPLLPPPIIPLIEPISANALKVAIDAVQVALSAYVNLVQSTVSNFISLSAGLATGDLKAIADFIQAQQEGIASYGSQIISSFSNIGSAFPPLALPEIPGLELPELGEFEIPPLPSLPSLPELLEIPAILELPPLRPH